MLATLLATARRDVCGGRLVVVTEGGYDLPALGACLDATVEVLSARRPGAAARPRRAPAGPASRGREAVEAVAAPSSGPAGRSAIIAVRGGPAAPSAVARQSTACRSSPSWPTTRPKSIEQKWQARWTDSGAFEVEVDRSRPKFYCLEMFAYPSGHAHVGHVRNYMIGDIVARLKRMQGFNVLHPFGWDAFGLPAENAAIKNNVHPETWTLANIAHMKGQLQRLGISYAWGREIATCLPDYYRWNQWLFLRMLEKGLAYRRRSSVNWCPTDQTVLANEQVIDGACWRCGTTVTTRELEQWFLRITQYADELLDGADEPLRLAREGADDAAELDRPVGRRPGDVPARRCRRGRATRAIEIFTTRIDTIYGATFVLLAPEHPLVDAYLRRRRTQRRRSVRGGRASSAPRIAWRGCRARSRRKASTPGAYAINPFTGEQVPIWVANFVLADYGTGAIMAVPVRRPARLRVRAEVRPADPRRRRAEPDGEAIDAAAVDPATMTEASPATARSVDSGEFTGLPTRGGVAGDGRSRRGARHRPAARRSIG